MALKNAAMTERDETRTISRFPLNKLGEQDVPGWSTPE